MDINFNPSQVSQPGYTKPLARPSGQPTAQAQADASASSNLKNQLQQLPLVRPEKVSAAKALLQDAKYPSDEVLDRVASLLADRLNG